MPVLTQCTHCGKQYRVNDDRVGRPFKCPNCGQPFIAAAMVASVAPAPAPSDESAAAQPPSSASAAVAPLPPPPMTRELDEIGIYQCDRKLVMEREIELPMICVKCGEPATCRVKKRFAQSFGGSVKVAMPLCDAHRSTKRWLLLVTWVVFIGCIVSWFVAIDKSNGTLGWLGLFLFVASMVLAIVTQNYLGYPSRIDPDYVWVKGLGKKFLEKLPPF